MRHMYEGLAIFLSGNYKNGAVPSPAECAYGHQFSEKRCRLFLETSSRACGNLSLTYKNAPFWGRECSAPSTWVVWSVGNHPVATHIKDRGGINNAEAYIESWPCVRNQLHNCSLIWMSTHHRMSEGDQVRETYARVEEYNLKIRAFFESGGCGSGIRHVDVYNMTKDLVLLHREEAQFMSFDLAHWGMEVNLNKVQVLLQSTLRPRSRAPRLRV